MADSEERLDEERAIEQLNEALEVRSTARSSNSPSPRETSSASSSSPSDRFCEFAHAEQTDARQLVEKIAALGGDPSTEVAEAQLVAGDPGEAVDWMIESEGLAIEALQPAIEPTGREGRSEAPEHLLEHLIMRKQNQVDFLLRARRS